MSSIIVEILPEKDGITKARFRIRERNEENLDKIDTLMKIIMGKYPKRAGFTDSTTILLEANTGGKDSSN